MITDGQVRLITALSTMFFQEPQGLEYWERNFGTEENYRAVDLRDSDGQVQYILFARRMDGDWYIGVSFIEHDEYGEKESEIVKAYIRVEPKRRACWELGNYARQIGMFICDDIIS